MPRNALRFERRVISLRKFWTAAEPEPDPAGVARVVGLLIQGIALHAVEGDRVEYETFRQEILRHIDAVQSNPPPDQLLMTVGAVLQILETYNAQTTRHLRMQGTELYHMINMLTRTVETLGTGSEKSIGQLREIEARIEKTLGVEDVRMLKVQMGECLDGIRAEAHRQKAEAARTVAGLHEEIRGSQERIAGAGAGPVLDPVTGVPARAAAAATLAEWTLHSQPPYAALFVVDRIQLLNARFGLELGDLVLKAYLQELRAHLPPGDQVYRWSGPAFLVLLHRHDSIDKVREHLRFALPGKLERNFELAKRSVLLSITATWAVFPIAPPLDEMIERLDMFLGTQHRPPPA